MGSAANSFLFLKAAESGNLTGLIQGRLDKVDFNTYDNDGWTALHWAVFGEHVACVSFLLENGASPNLFHKGNEAAIHLAAKLDNEELIQLLVKHGAKINSVDYDGDTPIHISVKRDNFYAFECLKYELSCSPDLTIKNKKGQTALDIAIEHDSKDMIGYLTAYQESDHLDHIIDTTIRTQTFSF